MIPLTASLGPRGRFLRVPDKPPTRVQIPARMAGPPGGCNEWLRSVHRMQPSGRLHPIKVQCNAK